MSTSQKIEVSREVRQWLGVAFGVGSAIIFAYMVLAPEKFESKLEKIKKRFNLY